MWLSRKAGYWICMYGNKTNAYENSVLPVAELFEFCNHLHCFYWSPYLQHSSIKGTLRKSSTVQQKAYCLTFRYFRMTMTLLLRFNSSSHKNKYDNGPPPAQCSYFILLMLHSTWKAVIEYSLNQHTVLFFTRFDIANLEQGSSSNDYEYMW